MLHKDIAEPSGNSYFLKTESRFSCFVIGRGRVTDVSRRSLVAKLEFNGQKFNELYYSMCPKNQPNSHLFIRLCDEKRRISPFYPQYRQCSHDARHRQENTKKWRIGYGFWTSKWMRIHDIGLIFPAIFALFFAFRHRAGLAHRGKNGLPFYHFRCKLFEIELIKVSKIAQQFRATFSFGESKIK